MGTFRGRFWRRAVSGRRTALGRRTNVRLGRAALPSYPYTKITSRKAVIGKIFNVLIDDVFWVPRGLSLSDDIFSLWFFAPVAQLDRVPGYGPGGRGFESLRARFGRLRGWGA